MAHRTDLNRAPSLRTAPGFTLIELAVVMAVFAIVAAFGAPFYLAWLQEGWEGRARAELAGLVKATEAYAVDHGGVLPGELAVLTGPSEERENAPYFVTADVSMEEGIPLDPWGSGYAYLPAGPQAAIFVSAGPNRVYELDGGDDIEANVDVTSWLRELTARELEELNLAVSRYNTLKLPEEPLPNDIALLVETLLRQGFLTGSAADLVLDAWGQPYIPVANPVHGIRTAGAPGGD
ncbi:MAG: prepilin-type N-terminal cleavage/methylation domain-containing protein [Planctomycetota bacterium]